MGILTVNSKEMKKLVVDLDELREVAEIFVLATVGFGIQAMVYLSAGKDGLEALSRVFLGF